MPDNLSRLVESCLHPFAQRLDNGFGILGLQQTLPHVFALQQRRHAVDSLALGLLHASRSDTLDIIPINDLDMLGMNLGGGAVGMLTERVGVRFDLRYFRNIDAPDWTTVSPPISIGPIRLRYWTVAFGVVITN